MEGGVSRAHVHALKDEGIRVSLILAQPNVRTDRPKASGDDGYFVSGMP
jgi:hypothetical protein